MHVNSQLDIKALLMLYNPLKEKITRTIKIPMYYSGLTTLGVVREKGVAPKVYALNRNYEMELSFSIEPESYTWFEIE